MVKDFLRRKTGQTLMEAESSLIFHPKFSLYFSVLIYLNGGKRGKKKIKEILTIKLKSQSSLTLMLLLQL